MKTLMNSLAGRNKTGRSKRNLLCLLTVALLALTGCEKDYNYTAIPKDNGGGGPVDTVYYKTVVEPMWAANGCAKSGCHSGAIDLDLRVGKSYASLFNTGSINTGSPASSDLYLRINASSNDPIFMPENGSPMAANDIQKVLDWIKQGAKDN